VIIIFDQYTSQNESYFRAGFHDYNDRNHTQSGKKPPFSPKGGLNGILDSLLSFLPAGSDVDFGDILLLLILFFLYTESKDEEFLIILIVLGISIFKK